MAGESQRAMVFGATGYVGRYVVEQWCKQGADCVAHVRPDSQQLEQWRARFGELGATVDASPWNLEALTDTLKKVIPSHLFCLIGTTRKRMSELEKAGADAASATYEAVDFGLTRLLVDACLAAEIKPRFVYLSAIGTGPNATGAYMKARYKAEMAVRESGLACVIARPPIITGADRDEKRTAEHLAGKTMDGLLAFAGALGMKKLQARWSSFTGQELARALVEGALQNPEDREVILESDRLRELGRQLAS